MNKSNKTDFMCFGDIKTVENIQNDRTHTHKQDKTFSHEKYSTDTGKHGDIKVSRNATWTRVIFLPNLYRWPQATLIKPNVNLVIHFIVTAPNVRLLNCGKNRPNSQVHFVIFYGVLKPIQKRLHALCYVKLHCVTGSYWRSSLALISHTHFFSYLTKLLNNVSCRDQGITK